MDTSTREAADNANIVDRYIAGTPRTWTYSSSRTSYDVQYIIAVILLPPVDHIMPPADPPAGKADSV